MLSLLLDKCVWWLNWLSYKWKFFGIASSTTNNPRWAILQDITNNGMNKDVNRCNRWNQIDFYTQLNEPPKKTFWYLVVSKNKSFSKSYYKILDFNQLFLTKKCALFYSFGLNPNHSVLTAYFFFKIEIAFNSFIFWLIILMK